MPKTQTLHLICIFGLILLVATMRIVPHPYNIAPIGALALFSGAYLQRGVYWLVPLGALLLGDLTIGLYNAIVMVAVYLGFLASAAIGRSLLYRFDSLPRICVGVGAGALAFWLISNFGVWLVFRPPTVAGLLSCYIDAIPFLLRSLAGDALYATLLFGAWKLVRMFLLDRQKLASSPH